MRCLQTIVVTIMLLGLAPAQALPFGKEKMKVIISMIGPQAVQFEKKLIRAFKLIYKIDVIVINVENIDDIEQVLDDNREETGLCMVPFGKSWSLVYQNKIMPLNTFLAKPDLDEFKKEYILTWLGEQNGRSFFMPHKYETRIMVYRKSKVDDAIAKWNIVADSMYPYRDTINTIMKAINGRGLPIDYNFEPDPNRWDYFDVFVAGALWARTPYDGAAKPRIAYRGKRYSGTSLGLIDRAFQCNADTSMVLHLRGDGVADAFDWEAAYAYSGILNKRMWEEGWAGRELWKAFGDNEIFMSFLTQIDCVFLHGTSDPAIKGFMQDPADIGFALMPEGCSTILDSKGFILRTGTRAITNGGWWWAIPAGWTAPDLSWKLFRYISNRDNQLDECTSFGMIPVREDVLKDKSILWQSGWISEMFRASYQQVQKNNNTIVPLNPHFDAIAGLYLDAWFDIVVGRNWSDDKGAPQLKYIVKLLNDNYTGKAQEILAK
jgi:hypothetical protein